MDRYQAIVALAAILAGGVTLVSLIAAISRGFSGRQLARTNAAGLGDIDARLARMEQAIDAMAVEMERVAEGQRFTSKLLAERPRDAAPLERRGSGS